MPSYEKFVVLIFRILYFLMPIIRLYFEENKQKCMYGFDVFECHPKRIYGIKFSNDRQKKEKSTKYRLFGFKLHVIINDKRDLMKAKLINRNAYDQ